MLPEQPQREIHVVEAPGPRLLQEGQDLTAADRLRRAEDLQQPPDQLLQPGQAHRRVVAFTQLVRREDPLGQAAEVLARLDRRIVLALARLLPPVERVGGIQEELARAVGGDPRIHRLEDVVEGKGLRVPELVAYLVRDGGVERSRALVVPRRADHGLTEPPGQVGMVGQDVGEAVAQRVQLRREKVASPFEEVEPVLELLAPGRQQGGPLLLGPLALRLTRGVVLHDLLDGPGSGQVQVAPRCGGRGE